MIQIYHILNHHKHEGDEASFFSLIKKKYSRVRYVPLYLLKKTSLKARDAQC